MLTNLRGLGVRSFPSPLRAFPLCVRDKLGAIKSAPTFYTNYNNNIKNNLQDISF